MGERVTITVELPTAFPMAALKQLLKHMLRCYRMKCVSVVPVTGETADSVPIPAAEAEGDENRATRLRQDASKAASMASDTFQVSGS